MSLSTAETKVYQNCNNVTVGSFARVYYTLVVCGVCGDVRVLLSWWVCSGGSVVVVVVVD